MTFFETERVVEVDMERFFVVGFGGRGSIGRSDVALLRALQSIFGDLKRSIHFTTQAKLQLQIRLLTVLNLNLGGGFHA